MTGTDIAAEFRGQYRTRKEALRLAHQVTGRKTLRPFLKSALSYLPTIPVLMAQRGDIVLIAEPGCGELGLISLNGRDVLAATHNGFARFPLSVASHAWRV